ncbi:hypothetical protein [Peribacillus asahii]|uniref:hypothetical protein n=1 Tax=Peribacillus asahii TaxID=228899 RepID=UPI00207AFB43|nr:hypothetical protein [Peribacillus asahii]USK72628.1 hypothetical protein LIS76_23575 [Peribacillus asahii]USK72744.1 hypothetical protein LIS76_23755 [Peribacillus asahii]
MENRKITRRNRVQKHILLCLLHKLNFDTLENETLDWIFVESDQADFGLAQYKLSKKVGMLNKRLKDEFFISIHGFYHGKSRVKSVPVEDFDCCFIKRKLKELKAV